MKEVELESFLTSDYIYLPFDNKDDINMREDGMVFRDDEITKFKNKKIHSPVSGKVSGTSQINSTEGVKNVLVLENNFKDDTFKKVISKKDIYEISESQVREVTDELIKTKTLVLDISNKYKIDFKDEYLLKEYIADVLETLNLIEQTEQDVKVKIRINKKNITVYQLLFSYMGTYPNIEIVFSKEKNETVISLYDVLDMFNKFKNKLVRDFIFVCVKNEKNIHILKIKRYSNLKEVLEYLHLMSTKILINENIKIESGNFLLDDSVKTINII